MEIGATELSTARAPRSRRGKNQGGRGKTIGGIAKMIRKEIGEAAAIIYSNLHD